MAKQTNAFQQLIHYIYEKLEGQDATVTESASLFEQNVDEEVKREVDVLIEKNIDGKLARIAIECRDRKCKDDIQWVDSLIGKYLNLEVHKVIAVSNSGYSKSAQLKAKFNGIELITLAEALNIDFNSEFAMLGMATVQIEFKLKHVKFDCLPRLESEATPEIKVFKGDEQISSLDELVSFCFEEGTKKKLGNFINQNFLDVFKTRADLDKSVLVEDKIPLKEFVIQSADGVVHQLLSLTLILMGQPTVEEVNVRHRIFEKALVTEGAFEFRNQERVHTLFAAQIPQAIEGRYFVKSMPRKQKRNNWK